MDHPPDDRARLLDLLRSSGWNSTSFQTLGPAFRYFFATDDSCVAYVDTGSAWVAAGAPIAPPARLGVVAHAFVHAARLAKRRAIFFGVETRFTKATPYPSLAIGEQPVWTPASVEALLKSASSLREQLRRARAKGVTVRRIEVAELRDRAPEIDAFVARFRESKRMAPMGFLVGIHPHTFADERRTFLAEQDGRLVGLLSAIPVYARRGVFFEHLLRTASSPNGTTESLFVHALRDAAARGLAYATLGLSPLAGPVAPWLAAIRDASTPLYDFQGLHAFKAKLRPDRWEPIYLAAPAGVSLVRAIVEALRAFSEGPLVRFGARTLVHRLKDHRPT